MISGRQFSALIFAALAAFTITVSAPAYAADDVELHIKNHKFIPETLEIPAGERVKIIVYNDDSSPEEFESDELHREKIVAGHRKGVVLIGPLDAGSYSFFGDFHPDTTQGTLLVK